MSPPPPEFRPPSTPLPRPSSIHVEGGSSGGVDGECGIIVSGEPDAAGRQAVRIPGCDRNYPNRADWSTEIAVADGYVVEIHLESVKASLLYTALFYFYIGEKRLFWFNDVSWFHFAVFFR